MPTRVLTLTGVNAIFAGVPAVGVTLSVAVAEVSPAELAVIDAVPADAAVNVDVAMPFTAAADAGWSAPSTPLTTNEIVLVAVLAVLPLASWIVAVYVSGAPTCTLVLAGASESFAGAPAVTVSVMLALDNPVADAVITALPVVIGVKVDAAIPPLGVTVADGLNEPETPVTAKVIEFVAVDTVLPFPSCSVAV